MAKLEGDAQQFQRRMEAGHLNNGGKLLRKPDMSGMLNLNDSLKNLDISENPKSTKNFFTNKPRKTFEE